MTEVAIVGAGPIGIELGAELTRAGLGPTLIDAGHVGATLGWWAPGTRFFSSPERIEIAGVPLGVAGQEKATREQYLDYLRTVAAQFQLDIRTYTRVVKIDRDAPEGPAPIASEGTPGQSAIGNRQWDGAEKSRFTLHLERSVHGVGGPEENSRAPGTPLEPLGADAVVLAIGNMHRPRMLGVPGEELPFVSHYLGDPHRYYGRRVLIVGGKNSAVEAAIRLHRVGARVTICHRRDDFDADRVKYWLLPELRWLIDKGKVAHVPGANISTIRENGLVEFARSPEGESAPEPAPDTEPFDDVLLLTGYVQDTTLFDQLGVELRGEEQRPAFDRDTMETNVPGVYVAGTGCGGTPKRTKVFIETSHVHVRRIVRALTGVVLPEPRIDFASLEEN